MRKNWVLLFGLTKNTPTVLFRLGTLKKLSFFYLGTKKITKRKLETNPICCLITYFGMNKAIFRVYVFIHACVRFHILSM